jgi:hypothetical protein
MRRKPTEWDFFYGKEVHFDAAAWQQDHPGGTPPTQDPAHRKPLDEARELWDYCYVEQEEYVTSG